MVGDYTMKKHIIIAPEFAIDSSIIKSIREKITGIYSSTKLQITLDEISHSEAENGFWKKLFPSNGLYMS